MARMQRGSGSLRPVVWLALLPLIVAVLTLAFTGLALWELALLLWHLTIRLIRTIRPGPQTAGEIPSGGAADASGEPPDPTLFVPAPREPAEDTSRLRALFPPGTTLLPLPWANLLRAKMAFAAVAPG
jgi:hypothetical protein